MSRQTNENPHLHISSRAWKRRSVVHKPHGYRSGAEHQAAGDHVMEGLLFFGDAGEDVADTERDAIPLEIGDDHVQYFFPNRALPIGTFEISVIEPACGNASNDDQSNGR